MRMGLSSNGFGGGCLLGSQPIENSSCSTNDSVTSPPPYLKAGWNSYSTGMPSSVRPEMYLSTEHRATAASGCL